MKMGKGKERYLNLTFEETGSTYIYMYWRYLNLTFEETGSTVTTNVQIVSDRQLVRNEYWYKILLLHDSSTTLSFTLSVCVVPLHVALTVALPNNIN